MSKKKGKIPPNTTSQKPQPQLPAHKNALGFRPRLLRVLLASRALFSSATLRVVSSGAVALIGLLVAYIEFSPSVSVTPISPEKAGDPLSWRFVISNDGFLPLYDVKTECHLPSIDFQEDVKAAINRAIIEEPSHTDPILVRNGKTTIECFFKNIIVLPMVKNVAENQITDAKILIIIRFKPFPNMWGGEKHFMYGTKKSPNSGLEWFPMVAPKEYLQYYNLSS